MIYNKYLLIFFILFLVCSFIIIYFSTKCDNKTDAQNIPVQNKSIKIENFSDSPRLPNNLIDNGSFQNGKNSSNNINQNGYNKIIKKKNPGPTPYVLHQKRTDQLTYYELLTESLPNSRYNLFFWMSYANDSDSSSSSNSLDLEKLIKIKIQNVDFTNYIPRLTYNIVQKTNIPNDDNTWYLIKYSFTSDDNTKNKMNIYLNYSDNIGFDNMYMTDIVLYRTLLDAENFIFNDELICYTDGYNFQSNTPTWNDLSGEGNDIFWSSVPVSDLSIGSLNSDNLKITGFPANILSNEKFTIIICLNKNYEEEHLDEIMETYLLSIPGNERYSFEIQISNKNNDLFLIVGNDKIKANSNLIIYNKSLLYIIYEDGMMNIYLDGLNILSKEINKLYFNKNPILFNRNKNLNLNFYSILFYNRIIHKKELNEIREYFITNQDKNFNTPDINIFHMDIPTDKSHDNISLFKSSDKKMNDKTNNFEQDLFLDNFDNHSNKLKDKYIKGEELDDCDDNHHAYKKCPRIYKKDGKYMVYSPETKMEKSYGTNLDKARYTYNSNFPMSPTPKELMPGEGKKYLESCPYTIDELNPCYTNICAGVDWSIRDVNKMNMNNKCKKSISNYCQINNNVDDNCIAWHPSKKNDPDAIKYRRYFENPNDYCSPNQFKIEEHPDFNKYIRKDNIPCWGCTVE